MSLAICIGTEQTGGPAGAVEGRGARASCEVFPWGKPLGTCPCDCHRAGS